MLVVRRKTPGAFPRNTVDLIKTFATQSVLAIQNARLFDSVETSDSRAGEVAGALADCTRPSGSDREAGIAWSTDCRHRARDQEQGFDITLENLFNPAAGEADLFPQEITRALLNLISNGLYAAMKRKTQANGGDYEPTLTAATKNLSDSVEIRIRDNGTGIPPEAKEKLFNPFFTTKPADEGTGLGLSICHDIIVKQHGGSIEVDTQPGEFTEFRIVLPRAGGSLIKSGERA